MEWNGMEYSILNEIFWAEKCSFMNHPLISNPGLYNNIKSYSV
jgi:hypothetical protein